MYEKIYNPKNYYNGSACYFFSLGNYYYICGL